jgi:aubergine
LIQTDLPQFNLQLWPGYVASVRQYESHLMMSASISTKVIRTQSAHQVISDLFRSAPGGEFRQRVTDSVLGCVVVTLYNNLTYRVDDVEYNVTPADEFATKDGGRITFIDYYKQVRHIFYTLIIQTFNLHQK